ncbi:MAG TPA: carboxypeptidase-like regulatory domain-containing protein, partial [Clostridia bacterium]|nr:carboxypeptidase-like regulatory domain-containing protein [Clostridia bacterium]
MKHMARRFFALLMTLVMLLTMIPATVTANPGEPEVFVVAGRITDSVTKKGLSGATVRLSNAEKEYTDTTDAFGYYQIDAREAGTYEISASLRGYTTEMKNDFVLDGTKDWFAELIPDGNPCIDIYANIKCVYSGIALSDVTVKAIHSSEGPFIGQTDEHGALVFENLPEGTYTFTVNETGQPGWESYISGEYTVMQDQLLNCSLKPNYESLTVKTNGFDAFSETANSPIRNVTVRLYGVDPKDNDVVLIKLPPQTTGENGTVTFENLVPIDWRIEAYSPGYDSIPDIYSDDIIVKATEDGTLELDSVTLDMVFHPATLIANLKSVYDDDEIYTGLEVNLCGINGTATEGLTRTVILFEGETFAEFTNLLPGQYDISTYGNAERKVDILVQEQNLYQYRVPNLEYGLYFPERVFSVTFQGQTPAVAREDQTVEIDLSLEVEKANYSGFLYKIDMDKLGVLKTKPASNTVMTLVPSEYYPQNPEYGKTYTVTTDEFGHYSFNVYPGLYGVTVTGMDYYWGAYADYRQRYIPIGEQEYYEYYGCYGWPYADTWQGDFASAIAYMGVGESIDRTGYADIGGMPLSSGITEGDLFMNEKVCSIELDVDYQASRNPWRTTFTGKIDNTKNPPDYKFCASWFNAANYGTEFSCNNIKVNAEQNSLPYKFVRVKPGTHDINITAREGETNVPRYILYYGVGESEWVPWPGSTFEFYDFPAPGILPVNFPADYCDFERRDTLWPAGYNGVDLEIRGVKEFKVSVLNQYIFHWVPPFKDSNGVITPGYYKSLAESFEESGGLYSKDDNLYSINSGRNRIYGWSSEIFPNQLFGSPVFNTWGLTEDYKMMLPDVPVTLYLTVDPMNDDDVRGWAEIDFNPNTGRVTRVLYEDGPDNNTRKGLDKAPAILNPFTIKVRARQIYTGEEINGISFKDTYTDIQYVSGQDYPNRVERPETYLHKIDVGNYNLLAIDMTSEYDTASATLTVMIDLIPNTEIELTVKDSKGALIPGAAVQLKSAKGFDEFLKSDTDGSVRKWDLKDENYTLVIDAPGYCTYTHELKAETLVASGKWKTFIHEAILVPLERPEISDESFDRFGGFLPHAGRVTSGDNYELVCILSREENAAKDALTLTVEAALQQQKYDEVTDKVIGMYIIDGKKFEVDDKSREGDYTEIDAATLPDPTSPQAVKEWLDKLSNRSAGLENVFFRYFDAECITQRGDNSDMADFSGEIMIYDLPAGPFKPIFIAVTEKGAYNIYTPVIAEDKQLVGLKKDGFLTFFHNVTEMYLEKRPFVLPVFIVPFFEFCPALDEATNLPEFTAEISEDEDNPGYLVYEYSLAVTADAGMANPGGSAGSPTSYLPDQLGIEFGGTFSASVSGKDKSINNSVALSVGAEFETEKYLPAAISDVATMEGTATGTASVESGIEYESDAKPSATSSNIGLTGELATTTNISGVGVAGKLFGGGALGTVFRTLKKWGIDLGVTIDANVGLNVGVGMTDNLKTPTAPDKLDLDVGLGLGAKAGLYGSAFNGSAGARGTIGFGGEHEKFESSMMTFDVKFVYDVEKGEFRADPATLKGVCEAEFEAFIDTAFFAARKSWNFEAFSVDMQFGTETKFTLTPVGVKNHEINRDTFGTSEFLADETSGIMVKDYLALATYATDENSGNILYTDLVSQGGDMRLQLSKFNGTTWQQPVTVISTDGAIGSCDLITLSDNRILITYSLIAKEDKYSLFPNSEIRYTVGTVGANGWEESASGSVAQLSKSYAFKSYLTGSTNPRLVCALTGGTGATGFDIAGYKWNGSGFDSAVMLKKNVKAFGINVAGNDNEAVVAYVEATGKLLALSWSGVNTVNDNVVAAETGSTSAVAVDANGFYIGCTSKGSIDFYTRGISPGSAWTKKGTPVSNVSAIEMDLAVNGDKLVLSFIKPSEASFDADNKLVVGNEGIASVTLAKDGTLYDEQRTYLENSQFYRNLSIVCVNGLAYAFAEDLYEDTADLVFVKIYDADAPVNFFGTVTITGNERFNEQLTATVSEDNSVSKNFTYTWKRGGAEIATGATYTTVAADIGKTLVCEVKTDDHQGVIRKATGVIAKAAGPAAPAGLAG